MHLHHRCHIPIGIAQSTGQASDYRQTGDEVTYSVLTIKLSFQTLEVGGIIGQAGRGNLQVELAHSGIGLPVAGHGQSNGFRRVSLAGQLANDHLFLRRNEHRQIALHQGLAGQSIALLQLGLGQTADGAAFDFPLLDHYLAATTSPLSPTGQVELQARLSDGLGEHCARGDGYTFARRFEIERDFLADGFSLRRSESGSWYERRSTPA